uniref:Uncharacterized protein n=1 Tax=Cacopsylla melanoneura TaxID=428564 RepID=A0A8D9ANF9_9HEMI
MSKITLPQFSNRELTLSTINDFERKFDFYLIANELDDAKITEKVRVAHLRLSLDSALNDVIDNLKIDDLTVKKIFTALKSEMLPKENKAYNQYKFFDRVQKPNESFNEYIMEIKNLASKCNLGDKYDDIVKCRIVHGVKDTALKERLYRSPDLSLQEVINYCRASEDAKSKMGEVGTTTSSSHVFYMGTQTPHVTDTHVLSSRYTQGPSNMEFREPTNIKV